MPRGDGYRLGGQKAEMLKERMRQLRKRREREERKEKTDVE